MIVTVCGAGGETTTSTTPGTAPVPVSVTVQTEVATIGAMICSLAVRAVGTTRVLFVPSVHDTASTTSPRRAAPGPSTTLRTRSDPVLAVYSSVSVNTTFELGLTRTVCSPITIASTAPFSPVTVSVTVQSAGAGIGEKTSGGTGSTPAGMVCVSSKVPSGKPGVWVHWTRIWMSPRRSLSPCSTLLMVSDPGGGSNVTCRAAYVFTTRTVGVTDASAITSAGTPVVVTATAVVDPSTGSVTVQVVPGANPPMTCAVGSTPCGEGDRLLPPVRARHGDRHGAAKQGVALEDLVDHEGAGVLELTGGRSRQTDQRDERADRGQDADAPDVAENLSSPGADVAHGPAP